VSVKRRRHNGEGSIFPRGNGYAAYVWVTTPAGRRQRKYVYGKTREAVHARWIELAQEASRGPVASSIPKLGAYLYRWLDEVVQPNLAPLTYATYETLVRLYIVPGLGQIRLDRLRVRDVQTWLNSLASTCQCCAQGKDARRAAKDPDRARCCAKGECCHGNASPRTIKDLRTVLRSALSTAMSDELIDKNVAALVKAPKIRQRKVVAWSSEEARQFLESARADNDSLYAVYVLILVLGLRKGEVLGLTWPAVDLPNQELTIGLQLQRVRRELLLRETKTDSSDAVLPLPDLCIAAIRLQAARQDAERDAAAEAWRGKPDGEGLVFTGRYGTPIDPRTLNRRFTHGARTPVYGSSECTTPARHAPHCSSTSKCTHGSSCASFGTPTSP
jgi:integrase